MNRTLTLPLWKVLLAAAVLVPLSIKGLMAVNRPPGTVDEIALANPWAVDGQEVSLRNAVMVYKSINVSSYDNTRSMSVWIKDSPSAKRYISIYTKNEDNITWLNRFPFDDKERQYPTIPIRGNFYASNLIGEMTLPGDPPPYR